MLTDIIAALSTPVGKGGVALIRVSGMGSAELVSKIFFPKSRKALCDYPPRFAVYGEVRDCRSVIDTALVTYFKAPASFTGEDMVEISCHGGYIVSSMVLEAVLESGARMAEAGEFTRRAFINDKMTLSEAEAVGDILSAVSREGVRLSSSQARGVLSERMKEITDKLTSLVSSLYAFIDYPEEDLEDVDDALLEKQIDELTEDCQKLLKTHRAASALTHGVPTVIVGKTNVGKSSLFNALLGEKKAIVTDIAGTTRDVIEHNADVKGVTLRLFDTAGLRDKTQDAVEQMGMDIAREKITSQETALVLALFDRSRPLDSDDRLILDSLVNLDKTIIPVFTKCDLPPRLEKGEVESILGKGLELSSHTLDGIEELKCAIFASFVGESFPSLDEAHLTGLRQKSVVERGIEALLKAKNELVSGMKDMTGMALEEALSILAEVDARAVGEEIVNQIFSKFCVGK